MTGTRTGANGKVTGWATAWRGNAAGLTEQNRRDWAQIQREWLHCTAAIGDGVCPCGHGSLDPVTMPGCEISGHCADCRKYWYISYADRETGFVLDHNPWDGTRRPPQRP
jgi:hypothetical protein